MLVSTQTLAVALAVAPTASAFLSAQSARSTVTSLFRSPSTVSSTTDAISEFSTDISAIDEGEILYDKQAWIQGFDNVEHESCYELKHDFPKDLQGTFFQNGHTKFYINKDKDIFHVHPFDADGMITAVTFQDGKAWFRNRYIETKGYVEERKAGKVLYRGVFGTARNKGKWWSNIFDIGTQKNVANTHVLFQPNTQKGDNPRLFALWEGGLPHEVDPTTLETIGGETNLDGTLDERYAAHYKIDPDTRTVCNFSINVNPPDTHTIQVFEHDLDTMELIYKKDYSGFPGIGLSHDCAITKDYFVFLQTKTKFDPLPFVLGKKGPAECIENDDEATTSSLILIPRGKEQKEPIIIETPKMFTFHLSNAFQTDDGMLVADMILADTMMMGAPKDSDYPARPIWETFDFDNGLKYQLRRVKVDLKSKQFVSMKSMTDGIANCEFPIINPKRVGKKYHYAYVAASNTSYRNGVVQGLAKVDVEEEKVVQRWKPERHEFLGEICFVPRDGNKEDEDHGYLMGFLFNGKEKMSELVLFDAKAVDNGPISRTKLDYMINFALHGTWVQGFTPEMTLEVVEKFASL
ncbi:carotenoid oxygenase [Nitzschia inconspicua]|uniref:Carotenoid oxygenase n=1 Tax=Nitzschia inconspicua TaxID=303405 RepID=A0A9K3PCH9_9STRA|nr:carotenoid oxygenase [Nitzschia inconspicua]